MGGKKKGGLANRLAKMSDEERAKYLQRKADMEEEARRRKEQLVATFMKNKLKKEDGFSRLNVAKINQQWHQVMRADKCKDMKEEVEYLRRRIDKIVSLKNRIIKKLMDELDWQEDLYGKNFSAHSDHIDKIIEAHNKNLEQLCKQYASDRKLLLHTGATERADYEKRIGEEIEFLKIIIHGQDVEARQQERETREDYMKRTDEILSTYRTELSQMKKEREKISCALWKQMSRILRAYVQQTDIRRSHLAELQRLDTEGAAAISANQQLINVEEEQLERLKQEYSNLVENREEQMRNLKYVVELTTQRFFKVRKTLSTEIRLDENQLASLSNVSNKAIEDLEKILGKGQQILLMIETCRKLETEDEKTHRWTPFIDEEDILIEEEDEPSMKSIEESPEVVVNDTRYKPKFSWEAFENALRNGEGSSSAEGSITTEHTTSEDQDQLRSEDSEDIPEEVKKVLVHSSQSSIFITKMRPTTAVRKPARPKYGLRQLRSEEAYKHSFTQSQENRVFQISTRLVKTVSTPTKSDNLSKKQLSKLRPTKSASIPKEKHTPLVSEKPPLPIILKPLKMRSSSAPKSLSAFSTPKPKLDRFLKSAKFSTENKFEVLDKLEGLWWIYNKVEMNCMKLKGEKKVLTQENNKLKEIIKDVLEAAALGQSIPSAKSASTAGSRKRFILSTPISSYSIL